MIGEMRARTTEEELAGLLAKCKGNKPLELCLRMYRFMRLAGLGHRPTREEADAWGDECQSLLIETGVIPPHAPSPQARRIILP